MAQVATIRFQMVEEVINEYMRDNPGKVAEDMTPKEFADRMMKKVWPTGHGEHLQKEG